MTDEDLRRIVVTGHDAAVPRLREQLPDRLSSKLVDVIQLDRSAGEGRILHATLEALRAQDAEVGSACAVWMAALAGTAGPHARLG